jgi:hypothetical protein
VITTIGVLIDKSVTENKAPGEFGTYEQINRNTAINIGTSL